MTPADIKLVIEESAKLLPKVANYYYDETERPPKKLYHYTTLDTLAKMLEKGLLNPDAHCFGSWLAGSCMTQNDRHEFGIAGGAFNNFVRAHESVAFGRLSKLIDQYGESLGPFLLNSVLGTYAICFSTKPDDLQQWLIYGDLGRGVCLEVDAEILWDIAKEHRWSFTDVLYGESEIIEHLESYLKDCSETLEGNYIVDNEMKFNPHIPLAVFIAFFSLVGAKAKSEPFRYEDEWRLFSESWSETMRQPLATNPRVLNKAGYLKHGVLIDLHHEKSIVTKIILGPQCTNPSTLQTIGTLLMRFDKCFEIPIEQSGVPFAG